jgi:hypothetical protein
MVPGLENKEERLPQKTRKGRWKEKRERKLAEP